MGNYKDLQNKAKELGLPYAFVPRVELEKSINDKLGIEAPIEPEVENPVKLEDIGVKEEVKSEPKKRGPKSKKVTVEEKPPVVQTEPELPKINEVPEEANTAKIYDGSHVMRVYTIENHGKDFSTLALRYVEDRPKMRIIFTHELPILRCPNCGSKIKCGVCGKDIA